MTHIPATPSRPATGARRVQALPAARYFYPAAAVLMLLFTALGFGRFYLQGTAYPGREIAPPIKLLVVAHGVSMTAWILLIVLQPSLIAARKRRLHMKIGRAGAVLAGLVVVLGVAVALRSAAVTPPEALIWGLPPARFLAVPLISILAFAVFVALGIRHRRTPHVHRTMMVLATLVALPAAVSRIDPLNALYVGSVWEQLFGPFLLTLVFGALLLAARWALTRSLDRVFALGLAVLILLSLAVMRLATTPAWDRVSTLLLG